MSSVFSKPVLSLDCALGGCIAAVLKPDGEAFVQTLMTDREQAAMLVPLVQTAMKDASVTFADLGLIVTTVGPGSFTGLRIGLSTARAWGLALNVPVQGVNTMEAMARSCADPDAPGYAVLLETKRSDYYFQLFDADFTKLSQGACVDVATAAAQLEGRKWKACGDAIERFENESGRAFAQKQVRALLDPVVLAKAGLEVFIGNGGKADKPEPVYLRGADVSISNKKNREIDNYQT